MDIEIKNLSVSFPEGKEQRRVLNPVSLTLKQGEITAVVGESGSGKSILGSAVIRLLDDSAVIEGEIYLGETNLLRLPEKEMNKVRGNRIGWIAQDPVAAMNPLMKIGKQVLEGICFHRKKKEEEEKENGIRQLQKYGLKEAEDIWDNYPYQLSGGMAQRVMTAMMTLPHPEWLIADEPTKGLDAFVREQVAEAFRQLKKQGIGIILITHDLRLAERISDRTAIIYKGDLVEFGKTADIFQNPGHDYTKKLFAAAPGRNRHSKIKEVDR